jgi:carbohydrate-binding DOMON domain-containing protein
VKVTIFVPRPGFEPKALKKTGCSADGVVGANTNVAVAVGAMVVVVVVDVLAVTVTAPGPTGFSSPAHPELSAAIRAATHSLRMPLT